MATANEILLNESVAHTIDLQAYSLNELRRILALLNRTDPDLLAAIESAVDKGQGQGFTVQRLQDLLKSVREINAEVYKEIVDRIGIDLRDLTDYEAGYQYQLFRSILPEVVPISTVNINQVYAAAMDRPFQGKLLKEFLSGLETSRSIAIRDAIRMGYVEGQTTDQIVRRIRGTRALNYADGLLQVSRRNLDAVVLTAISHTASYARDAVFEANSDIIKADRYTATLDMRTTVLCASRDGNEYPKGKPKPALPAHMRCRSVYVPVLKSWREMGAAIDVEMPASTRASLDGQVPGKMTYQEWLRKQSASRQNEVLGVDKAKLFRDGGLSLDKFVARNGHVFTLQELRERDSKAFTRAGLQ